MEYNYEKHGFILQKQFLPLNLMLFFDRLSYWFRRCLVLFCLFRLRLCVQVKTFQSCRDDRFLFLFKETNANAYDDNCCILSHQQINVLCLSRIARHQLLRDTDI